MTKATLGSERNGASLIENPGRILSDCFSAECFQIAGIEKIRASCARTNGQRTVHSIAIASVAAWIKSGYAAGAWNGPGISSLAAQVYANYGVGYADAADLNNPAGLPSGEIEVKFTLLGDANLDGKVNGIDFAILASNFNQAVSAWDEGDFNYDGKVNGIDFADLAENFNQGASEADIAALDAFASAHGLTIPSFGSVPEPASLALICAPLLQLWRRRRRL